MSKELGYVRQYIDRGGEMSVKLMSLVWENGPEDSTQRFVLLAIADHAADDGSNAYPSIPHLARKCALSERSVIRAVKELVDGGYLTKRRRKDDSNLYQVVVSALKERPQSLWEVTNSHIRTGQNVTSHSDTDSYVGVTDCHQGGDTVSPKPSYNHQSSNRQKRGGNGANAPAGPPATSPYFQDIPEVVQAQRRAAKIDELLEPSPMPTIYESAPAAMTLVKAVTGYWPGENNRAFLVEKLGDAPDEAALRQAFKLWSAAGNKPTNFAGICDWYQELLRDPAWTPQARFKGNGRAAQPVAAPLPELTIVNGLY